MAAFFGTFYGATGVLAMLIQVLLTPRLLRYFGIGVALFDSAACPDCRDDCDYRLRRNVGGNIPARDRQSGPVLHRQRGASVAVSSCFRRKQSTGQVVSGYRCPPRRLTAWAPYPSFADRWGLVWGRQLGWIVLALLLLWIVVARQAGKQYIATLGDSLHQHRLDVEGLRDSPWIGPQQRCSSPVFGPTIPRKSSMCWTSWKGSLEGRVLLHSRIALACGAGGPGQNCFDIAAPR